MLDKFKNLTPPARAAVIIAVMGAVLSVYNIFVPIYLDEAYYWVWSLTPEWSYYDHPGMTAWIMRPFSLLGTNTFLVRLPTVICMSAAIYYLFRLTYLVAGERPAWTVLVIFSVIPATQMGYVFMTPDSPLIAFWAAAMYYTWLAVDTGRTRYFIIAGLLTGCAMLSKYAGVLFPAGVFIFILIRRRDLFKNPRLWLAALTAALCVLPIFYWNYRHEWISIAFQYGHGTSSGFTFAGWDFVLFVLGSLLIPTPILAWILIKYLFDKKLWFRDDSRLYLVVLTLFPMFFFFYKGFFKKMELNWIIPAFLAGAVLIGIGAAELKMKKTLKYGCIFAVVLSVLLRLAPVLPFPPRLNIADRLLGYDEVCRYVADNVGDNDAVFSDHLTTASMLRFYIKDHRRVYIPVVSRFSQYTLWDNEPGVNMLEKDGLYVGKRDAGQELEKLFSRVEPLGVFESRPGNATPKIFYIYRCYGRKG